jgi:hypothetical protein
MVSNRWAPTIQSIPQAAPYTFPAEATAFDEFPEVFQPAASSSANASTGASVASDPAPSAWEQLLGFNELRYDASPRLPLVSDALDVGAAAVAELPPTSGEQLAAWLALANADDIARFINGGYAPTPGTFGTDAAYGYQTPTSAPVLSQAHADGLRLDGHRPLPGWPQEPSGFE